jgi:hypothetical protein
MQEDEFEEYPRAEEIISEVWRQIREIRIKNLEPGRIIMNLKHYRMIQDYHNMLGEVPDGFDDYIQRYSLFGVPFFIDDVKKITVEKK